MRQRAAPPAVGIVISGLTVWVSAPPAAAKACGGFDGVFPSAAVLVRERVQPSPGA